MYSDEIEEAAQKFVEEYLQRTPEFIDVTEFVDELFEDEDKILIDDDYDKVYADVVRLLADAHWRFVDI